MAYDISDDLARNGVAAELGATGLRLQRSVFEVETADAAGLVTRIEDLINPLRDIVHAFPVCGTCRTRILTAGQTGTNMRQHWWLV